jgi:thiol:disulfide interchange protein
MRKLCILLAALGLAAGLMAAEYPRMGSDIYDPEADGSALIAAALARAKAENKSVLLDFGANWCVWCHRLHHTFTANPGVAAALAKDYVVVMIDVNPRRGAMRNAGVDARYGHPTRLGLPVLVVLDAEGRQLATQDTGALESGSVHSPAKIRAFLARWTPGRQSR